MLWEKKPQAVVPQRPQLQATHPARVKLESSMSDTTITTPSIPNPNAQRTLLGRTTTLRGQISGDEDVTIDGQFEGTVSLPDHCLTVGADGQVKAEVHAGHVIVQGKLTGNISARNKVEIRRTGHVVGDLMTASVAIEEGAYFKGSIEIVREQAQEEPKSEAASGAIETVA
jgi:cytoskeletal protein CcmA (bactofilin family)